MYIFIVKRLMYLLFVLWGISLGTFALMELAPGDPAEIILRNKYEAPGKDQIQALREKMNLDSHWAARYLSWLNRVVHGELGNSRQNGEPVWDEIVARFPATFWPAVTSFMLLLLMSLTIGGISAFFYNRLPDFLMEGLTVIIVAMPTYWLGLLLIYFFSVQYHIFPAGGYGSGKHLILPSITLAAGTAMLQARVLRAALIEISSMDYIRFAVSKGLSPLNVFFRHMLKNALPPMVSMWSMSLGQLLGGTVIVESVFGLPGIGRLTVEAVMTRDVPLIQAVVLVSAVAFVVLNQMSSIVLHLLDPKQVYAQ